MNKSGRAACPRFAQSLSLRSGRSLSLGSGRSLSLRSGRSLSLRSGRKHKAWGASPRLTSKLKSEPAIAGGSLQKFTLSPVSRALNIFLCFRSWGLRPRLYAVACFAGFMLTPASQAPSKFRGHPIICTLNPKFAISSSLLLQKSPKNVSR